MADTVRYWLEHGLGARSDATVKMYTTYADKHVIPALGARKLTADLVLLYTTTTF